MSQTVTARELYEVEGPLGRLQGMFVDAVALGDDEDLTAKVEQQINEIFSTGFDFGQNMGPMARWIKNLGQTIELEKGARQTFLDEASKHTTRIRQLEEKQGRLKQHFESGLRACGGKWKDGNLSAFFQNRPKRLFPGFCGTHPDLHWEEDDCDGFQVDPAQVPHDLLEFKPRRRLVNEYVKTHRRRLDQDNWLPSWLREIPRQIMVIR